MNRKRKAAEFIVGDRVLVYRKGDVVACHDLMFIGKLEITINRDRSALLKIHHIWYPDQAPMEIPLKYPSSLDISKVVTGALEEKTALASRELAYNKV